MSHRQTKHVKQRGACESVRLCFSALTLTFFLRLLFRFVFSIGRVVNRFSSDTDKLDHMLIRILEGYGGCVFFVLGTFVAICVVFPYFAIVLVVVIAIYWRMQLYYVTSSRELQRLDNISKSPIFSHFGESLAGAASIRAFASTEACLRANEAHIDLNQRAILAFQGAICWRQSSQQQQCNDAMRRCQACAHSFALRLSLASSQSAFAPSLCRHC